MSHAITPPAPKDFRLLEESRALSRPGWLPPDDVLPGLARGRQEHQRLLGVVRDAGRAANDLVRRQQDLVAAWQAEARDTILAGGESTELAPLDRLAQEAEYEEAWQHVVAAKEALQSFARDRIQEVCDGRGDWENALAAREVDAEARREAARRILAEADAEAAELVRLRQWLNRTTGAVIFGHMAWDEIEAPPPPTDGVPLAHRSGPRR